MLYCHMQSLAVWIVPSLLGKPTTDSSIWRSLATLISSCRSVSYLSLSFSVFSGKWFFLLVKKSKRFRQQGRQKAAKWRMLSQRDWRRPIWTNPAAGREATKWPLRSWENCLLGSVQALYARNGPAVLGVIFARFTIQARIGLRSWWPAYTLTIFDVENFLRLSRLHQNVWGWMMIMTPLTATPMLNIDQQAIFKRTETDSKPSTNSSRTPSTSPPPKFQLLNHFSWFLHGFSPSIQPPIQPPT